MKEEFVILVDEHDKELGIMEKMHAHKLGILHRAFSIFIFNSQMQLLLQKRAPGKYHSGGLWTNTCCSHPRIGEDIKLAALRRLNEEMGLSCELQHVTTVTYKANLSNDMFENELDHIFIGYSDTLPKLNPAEVSEYKYMELPEVQEWLINEPWSFTEWFKILFEPVKNELKWKKH